MKTECGERRDGVNLSQMARARMLSLPGEPLFIADWRDLFFLHFEVDAEVLQREVPYPLDLFEGRAFVSLVSFGLERLRLFKSQPEKSLGTVCWCHCARALLRLGHRFQSSICSLAAPSPSPMVQRSQHQDLFQPDSQPPTLTEALFAPFTRSHFLNVRAYVTHRGEPGIYFMQEFLSNKLSIPFGRPLYGLPYHYAAANREIDRADGRMDLELHAPDQRQLTLRATFDATERPEPCEAGSLTEFLLERYTAYTCHRGIKRRFRIWHPAWQQRAVAFQACNNGLLNAQGHWFENAEPIAGHYAVLGKDVWMGRPCGV